MTLSDRLERFENPEYTGSNRCTPCTVVNVVIAAIGSIAVFVVTLLSGVGATIATAMAAVIFTLSAITIYLRGYLVPGTPWFTRTYFPTSVLRRFDTGPSDDVTTADELDVDLLMKGAGATNDTEDSRTGSDSTVALEPDRTSEGDSDDDDGLGGETARDGDRDEKHTET